MIVNQPILGVLSPIKDNISCGFIDKAIAHGAGSLAFFIVKVRLGPHQAHCFNPKNGSHVNAQPRLTVLSFSFPKRVRDIIENVARSGNAIFTGSTHSLAGRDREKTSAVSFLWI